MIHSKKKTAILRSTGEDAFFAASNSANGFHSYYSDCFDAREIGRVYVIKGGPGTGKSRFMREVSVCGRANGWHVRMIYCSSDADSLDGVILQKGGESIALLDGTAPHIYEPKLPGVREEIINLGDFWDSSRLRAGRERIEELNQIKRQAYRMAYRYLSAYGSVYQNRSEKMSPYMRRKAIADYAKKLMQQVPTEEAFSTQTALISSVGMRGVLGFDTYLAQAKKRYLIEDCKGCGELLLMELYRLASEKRLRVRVSRDPILPELIDGLFLVGSEIAFVLNSWEEIPYPYHRISTRRFVKISNMGAVRESVRFDVRMCQAMLDGVLEQMEEIRQAHFALEDVYSQAMDFERKEEFTKKFCNSLFDLKNG